MLAVVMRNSFAADRGMICTTAWCCTSAHFSGYSPFCWFNWAQGHKQWGGCWECCLECCWECTGQGRFHHQRCCNFWLLWVMGCHNSSAGPAQSSVTTHLISTCPQPSPKCSSSHQHSLDSGLLKLHVVSVCSLTPKRNCVPQPPCMSLLAPTTSSDAAFQHFSPKWRECVWKWHSLVSKQKFGEIGVFLAEIFSHGQCLQTKVFIL